MKSENDQISFRVLDLIGNIFIMSPDIEFVEEHIHEIYDCVDKEYAKERKNRILMLLSQIIRSITSSSICSLSISPKFIEYFADSYETADSELLSSMLSALAAIFDAEKARPDNILSTSMKYLYKNRNIDDEVEILDEWKDIIHELMDNENEEVQTKAETFYNLYLSTEEQGFDFD